MNLNKLIKEQSERNRKAGHHYLDLRSDSVIFSPEEVDQLTKDTALAVRDAVVEMVKEQHTYTIDGKGGFYLKQDTLISKLKDESV